MEKPTHVDPMRQFFPGLFFVILQRNNENMSNMIKDSIEIIDAQENNLKHVNVSIPKGELVVFCGVSGSGKSSLAFDTIAKESNRQWQENYPLFLRNKMPHYDRAKVESIENLTPAVVVDQHSIGVSSRSTVGTALDVAPLVRLLFSRCGEPSAGGSMAYSANHPMGMCPHCTGLGTDLVLKEDLLFYTAKTLREGAIRFSQFSNGWQTYLYQANPKINTDKKLCDFTADEWDYLKYGERENDGSVSKKQIKVEIRSNNTGRIDKVDYEGVIPRFERLYLKRDITKLKRNLQDEILSFVEKGSCPHCGGTGLNPKALKSKINGKNIADYGDRTDGVGNRGPISYYVCTRKRNEDGSDRLSSQQECGEMKGGMADILIFPVETEGV